LAWLKEYGLFCLLVATVIADAMLWWLYGIPQP
jgi:hypothetical protein